MVRFSRIATAFVVVVKRRLNRYHCIHISLLHNSFPGCIGSNSAPCHTWLSNRNTTRLPACLRLQLYPRTRQLYKHFRIKSTILNMLVVRLNWLLPLRLQCVIALSIIICQFCMWMDRRWHHDNAKLLECKHFELCCFCSISDNVMTF